MIDKLKDLLFEAVIAMVIGGVISLVIGMVFPMVTGITLVGGLIGGLLTIVMLLYIGYKTTLDSMTLFDTIILLLAISVLGTFIISIVPAAAPFILTTSATLTVSSLAWSLIYVGLAMVVYDMAT